MSDPSTSGSTPPEAPAATAGAPTAPATDWGAAYGANRGSGLARGKRVSTPATPAPVSNTAATGSYQPSAVQVLKAETEYQNPFAAPAPAAAAPVVAQSAEAPAPAPVAPVAPVVKPTAPAPKAELNILPPAEVKHPSQSWETPAFPYEGNAPAPAAKAPQAPAPARPASPLSEERPVFRPVRRSDVPMLERAPDASGSSPRDDSRGGQRGGQRGRGRGREGNNRPQQQPRDNRSQQQPRDRNRPAGPAHTPAASGAPVNSGQPAKKPGLFGWVKGLFGTMPPAEGKPSAPSSSGVQPPAQSGERPDGTRRRRRRGGRGRSGGGQGGQGGPNGPHGVNPTQSHGQGHPSHGHGGGEHRPHGQGGGRRRRGGRGRSGGGGQGGQGGHQGGGHRHDGGGSGIPPSA